MIDSSLNSARKCWQYLIMLKRLCWQYLTLMLERLCLLLANIVSTHCSAIYVVNINTDKYHTS